MCQGCAKTTLVRALASGTGCAFMSLDGAAVYSAYLGEAEKNIRQLFTRARYTLPSLFFFFLPLTRHLPRSESIGRVLCFSTNWIPSSANEILRRHPHTVTNAVPQMCSFL